MDTLTQLIKAKPEIVPILKKGEIVSVKLVEKASRVAYFEVQGIGTGVVLGRELMNGRDILKPLNTGEVISAKVSNPENEDGFIELSLTEADKQKSWQIVKELQEKDEPIKVKIVAANSGGLMTEIEDLKAFLPVSQLSSEHYPRMQEQSREKLIEELSKFVGQELEVKIISINQRTNKLIVSEKEVLSQNVKDLINKYKVGDIVPGIISGLANFGAFIRFADNPEIEGLIHISELDHRLIESPKEVVTVGDMVNAKVMDIKDNRISLSLKALQPDPWKDIDKQFKAEDVVKGLVYKFNPFGAFIKLNDDIVGLIHVSEFGSTEAMRSEINVGQTYDFLIVSIKPEEKRIVLKLANKKTSTPIQTETNNG
ncbi:MAG TPA: S1 RNA-binding domain-containing protein [Candidatus Colwellbacteria bacterium]|nr:S1 RNA-binding domain-containing protein [Candidatus Colwellbacteria bacterium]